MPSTVLLLDADPDTRVVIGVLLRAQGHVVLETADIPDALAAARTTRPDVVITTYYVPRPGGECAFDALRFAPELADLPILVLCTCIADEIQEHVRAAGATLVCKPLSAETLLRQMRSLARRTRTPA